MVGIGTGHQPHEFRSMGMCRWSERYERFLESWDVLEMAWRDGRVTFQGNHLHIPETLVFGARQWADGGPTCSSRRMIRG